MDARTPRTAKRRPAPAKPARPFQYKPQFGLTLICPDEVAQRRLYEQLLRQGHKPRVVCV